MKTYWGDLHNHCAVSYGEGTPQRALANARAHLDFCTVTGHAFWPDLPMDLAGQNAIIGMHLGGFAKLRHFWGDLLAALEAANVPGSFVTLPSYEWHSMEYGDHNCYFDRHDPELLDAPDPGSLAATLAASGRDFFMLPHHCAYQAGMRGTNWAHFDPVRSPLVEIFSNHGCGEADDAPYDYHHSMGPRVGASMVRSGLLAGHRFGFYASTDSHDGYPGHYGHGITGVFAERLDLPSLWAALKARRTVASTGARFLVDASYGGAGIGESVRWAESVPFRLEVEGTAPVERIDLVEGAVGSAGVRVSRFPGPPTDSAFRPGRHKIKVECGWGRAGDVSDWRVEAHLRGGLLRDAQPCFRFSKYRPGEEEASESILERDVEKAVWTCRAAANPAGMLGGTHFHAGGTQAVVLDADLAEGASLVLRWGGGELRLSAADLAAGSVAVPSGGFGSPALKVHRAVPEREFRTVLERPRHRPFAEGPGFAYFRIVQSDGQVAWPSPFFLD